MNEFIHSVFWILLAKVILVLLMFAFGAVCIVVFKNSREWESQLLIMELECDTARDMAMIQGTMLRSQLREIQDRLSKKPEKAEMEIIGTMMKQAMPLVTLFMAKETSIIKWGFAGAKLAKTAFEWFQNKK